MTDRIFPSATVIVIAIAVGTVAFGIGFFTQYSLKQAHFYQAWAPETVLFACGRGLAWPINPPSTLLDFLTLKAHSFDCLDLTGVETMPPQPFLWTSFWLYLATGLSWKLFGVSQAALAPLLGAFHASYAVGAFALARLYFPLWGATLIGSVIVLSPIALSLLPVLRDYSKAPFILWLIVATVCLVRKRGTWAAPVYASFLGIILAIAAGFRPDVWVLGPSIALALLVAIFSAGQSAMLRLTTLVALGLPLALGLLPQVMHPFPAMRSSPLLQGATLPFDIHLKVARAGYDLGHVYSDELTMSAMVVDIDDARAGRSEELQARELARMADAAALKKYVVNFPADIATRALKATVLVAGFYPLFKSESRSKDPAQTPFPGAAAIEKFAFSAMPIIVIPGLLIWLAAISSRSLAETLIVGLVLVSVTASQSVQFSARHFFHLEWIPWFGLLGYLYLPQLIANNRALLLKFAVGVAVLASATALTWAGLRTYQSHHLAGSITALLEGKRENVAVVVRKLEEGSVEIAVPVPEAYEAIIKASPDYLSEIGPIRPPPPNMRIIAAGERLLLTIGGPTCRDQTVRISTLYERTPAAWQDLRRDIEVRTSSKPEERVMVLLPALYRPTQWLTGLRVSSQASSCVESVQRLVAATSLPLLFSAVLEPEWRIRPMRLGFGRL